MAQLLIKELIEDSTFVLDIEYLPDEAEFHNIRTQIEKEHEDILVKGHKDENK